MFFADTALYAAPLIDLAFWWIPLIIAGAQMMQQQQAQKEQKDQFNQLYALQAQKDAEQQRRAQLAESYATAASDPQSEAFRNMSEVYRQIYNQNALQGARAYESSENRQMARGLSSRSERFDEAKAAALTRMFHDAGLQATGVTRQTLLDTSKAISGTPGGGGDARAMAAAIFGQGKATAAQTAQLAGFARDAYSAYASRPQSTSPATSTDSVQSPYNWQTSDPYSSPYIGEIYGGGA